MRAAYFAESRCFFALILLYMAHGVLLWSDTMVLRCIIIVVVAPMIWMRSLA